MKKQRFLVDVYVFSMAGAGVALNLGLWFFLKSSLDPNAPFIILHFTAAAGADLIGETAEIYQLPYLVAAVSLANLSFARVVYHYDTLSSYLLLTSIPLLNAIAFLNGYLLVSVNT